MEKLNSDPSRTPFGTLSQNTVWANADHVTLTAAGIPGLYFNTVGTSYLTRNYHTNYDILSNVNFDYLAQNIEVINDIWVDHDRATLPLLDFVARATEASSRIAYEAEPGIGLGALPGVDPATLTKLQEAVQRFADAASALDAKLATGRCSNSRRVAALTMRAERLFLTTLVALDVFDQYIFPHQQLQRDATRMPLAVDSLESGDPVIANDTYVRRTGLTSAGRLFAYETYVAELARHEPSSDRLQWGGQGHLSPYVDLWQEYHAVADKISGGLTDPSHYSTEIASLKEKLQPVYHQLNGRLDSMAQVFERGARLLTWAAKVAH